MNLEKVVRSIVIASAGNRVTYMGYWFLAISYFAPPDYRLISSSIGLGLLTITGFGGQTLEMYNRTKDHIIKHGTLEERFAGILLRSSGYCGVQGMRLAARDMGCEELLKEYIDEQKKSRV